MSDTKIDISGGTATITFGSKAKTKNLEIRTDPGTVQQFITTTIDSGAPDNRGAVGKQIQTDKALPDDVKKVVITLKYLPQTGSQAGKVTESRLRIGGPYTIGRYWLVVIATDNGDDGFPNDAVVRLSGNTA